MILEIVRRTATPLPDALEVRLPVWSAWDASSVGDALDTGRCHLRGSQMYRQKQESRERQNCRDRSIGHRSTTTFFSV
jgi:hypothetical protein